MGFDDFDLLILGAGPAGMSSALAGLRAGKRILILDSGPNDGKYYHVRDRVNIRAPIGGILGISSVWGGQLVMPTTRDLENFSSHSNKQVISRLMNGINSIKEYLNIDLNLDNKYPEISRNFSPEKYHPFDLIYSTYLPTLNLKSYFQDVIDSPLVTILETKISWLSIDKHFNLLSVGLEDGIQIQTQEKKVIVALGALESARLILKSNTVTRRVPVLDHPQGYILSLRGKGSKELRTPNLLKFRGRDFRRKFLYSNSRREGVIEFHENLNLDLKLFFKSPLVVFRRIINRATKKLGLRYLFVPDEFLVWVQIDQVPNENSYIELKDGAFNESWSVGTCDLEFIEEIEIQVRTLAKKINLEVHAEETLSLNRCLFPKFDHAYHPSSTLFSSDSSETLLLRFGKFENSSNFAIASSAIFPTSGWLNPTLFIMGMSFTITEELIKPN